MVCLGWTRNTRHPSFHCCWKKAACGFAEPEHSLHIEGPSPCHFALWISTSTVPGWAVKCTGLSAGFLPAQPGFVSQNAAWICNQPSMLCWLTGWHGSAGARDAFRVGSALHFIPWLLPQPAAAPLPLTCAGVLGTCCQVQSSSLLVTPTWPVGRLGPCRFPQPCQKQQKILWLWGSSCRVHWLWERGATWAKAGGPRAGFPPGDSGNGVQACRIPLGSRSAEPQTCGSPVLLPQGRQRGSLSQTLLFLSHQPAVGFPQRSDNVKFCSQRCGKGNLKMFSWAVTQLQAFLCMGKTCSPTWFLEKLG